MGMDSHGMILSSAPAARGSHRGPTSHPEISTNTRNSQGLPRGFALGALSLWASRITTVIDKQGVIRKII